MGRTVEALLARCDDLILVFRADRALHASSGPPRTGPDLTPLRSGEIQGIIDFSQPEGAVAASIAATRLGCPLVSGTTGLDDDAFAALRRAARDVPVCWSPNFSVGIPFLEGALRELARHLPQEWQIEIVETHHAGKRDAPSGTALRLAQTWRDERGGELRFGRHGPSGPRTAAEVGVHALRLGDVVGEHRILLGRCGETLEVVHRAQDRTAFASGSVEALRGLLRKGPGWYEWNDLARGR